MLANLPVILCDLLQRRLQRESDLRLVVSPRSDLRASIAQVRPDVLVIPAGGELPDLGKSLLEQSPGMRILALERDGRDAVLYELRPHKTMLGEASQELLLRAIRAGTTRNE